MSFLIVILFVAGSIGLIVVACNVKDDYPSEQDWEKAIIELERLHEMFSHVLDGIENKNNNHNEKQKGGKEMIELECVDGRLWYEVAGDTKKPVGLVSVVKCIGERSDPDLRLHELRNGDVVIVSNQIVKGNLRIGDKWEQYPYMTCVRKIYAPHKWWQFWKWRKLVGYEMRYCKE